MVNTEAYDYSYFKIDGSEFSNDIHIGLANTDGLGPMYYETKSWEIVIGGWAGEKSVIRKDVYSAHAPEIVTKEHSSDKFNNIKGDIRVFVVDGELTIKAGDEIFMQYRDASIKKNNLNTLLVSGGYGAEGTYKITGVKEIAKGKSAYSSNQHDRYIKPHQQLNAKERTLLI